MNIKPNHKNILTLKGISQKQKDALIAGGLSFTALAMGAGLFKLLGTEPVMNEESFNEETEPFVSEIEDVYEESSSLTELESVIIEAEPESLGSFEAEYSYSFYSEATFSNAPTEGMTFSEAFLAAREDVGDGGFFNYNETSYSTFYKEEWENMSPENQQAFLQQVNEKTNFSELVNETEIDLTPSAIVEEYTVLETTEVFAEETPVDETLSEVITDQALPSDTKEENLIENDSFFNDLDEVNEIIVKPVYGADTNDDGVVDMIALDRNEDGIADVVALDDNYDGEFESYMINEDGGQNLDVFVVDEGKDGIDENDSREEIDDIVSMEDFVILGEDDAIEAESLEMLEKLIEDDNSTNLDQNDISEEGSSELDFEDFGL